MRKLALVLSTAALSLSGAAMAQTAPQASAQARAPRPDITRAQVQSRAEAVFARMDVNRDGTLNEADRAARQAAMFDRLDSDRNGAISRTEFDAKRSAKNPHRAARKAARRDAPALTEAQKSKRRAERFARIDTDGNGALSRAELTTMQAARTDRAGGKPGQRLGGRERGGQRGMMMAMAGGAATRQAFVERALQMFDRADADRNGTVTQAERKAARDTLRREWQARRAPGQQG